MNNCNRYCEKETFIVKSIFEHIKYESIKF